MKNVDDKKVTHQCPKQQLDNFAMVFSFVGKSPLQKKKQTKGQQTLYYQVGKETAGADGVGAGSVDKPAGNHYEREEIIGDVHGVDQHEGGSVFAEGRK